MTLGTALWIGIPGLIFAVGLAVWLSAKDNRKNPTENRDHPDRPWWL